LLSSGLPGTITGPRMLPRIASEYVVSVNPASPPWQDLQALKKMPSTPLFQDKPECRARVAATAGAFDAAGASVADAGVAGDKLGDSQAVKTTSARTATTKTAD
jgi:hypothetical protein